MAFAWRQTTLALSSGVGFSNLTNWRYIIRRILAPLGEIGRSAFMNDLRRLMPHETALFDLPELGQLPNFTTELTQTTQVSNQVFLLVPYDPSLPQKINAVTGLVGVCIKFKLQSKLNPDSGLLRYLRHGDRNNIAQKFAVLKDQLPPHFKLAAELEVEEAGLEQISSTLISLAQANCAWVFLDMRAISPRGRLLAAQALKDAFSLLRIKNLTSMNVHIHELSDPVYWNSMTSNPFNGPARVDIDLANSCTHNCVFCCLYGPSFIAKKKAQNGGSLPAEAVQHMKQKIDPEVFFKLIDSLPMTTKMIQLGGAGDPLTHPQALGFITSARKRGLEVEVLTNFAYLDEEKIQQLHQVSGDLELRFIINLSAATGGTFSQIRPNQTAAAFAKILEHIRLATELRRQSKDRGMLITLMSVINRWNWHEMKSFVQLGKDLNVGEVYLKPLELHDPDHRQMLPTPEVWPAFKAELRGAMELAQSLNIRLNDEGAMHSLLKQLNVRTAHESQVL